MSDDPAAGDLGWASPFAEQPSYDPAGARNDEIR